MTRGLLGLAAERLDVVFPDEARAECGFGADESDVGDRDGMQRVGAGIDVRLLWVAGGGPTFSVSRWRATGTISLPGPGLTGDFAGCAHLGLRPCFFDDWPNSRYASP